MFNKAKLLFGFILAAMIAVTVWASVESNVMNGFAVLWRERWGIATLMDAYCGFLTFCAWVVYREKLLAVKIGWFVAIMILGNIGMSFYVLRAISKVGPNGTIEDVLLGRTA